MSRIDALIADLCPDGVEFKAIGEFGELVRGNGMPKSDFVEAGVGCIHYGQIYTYYGAWASETISFVPAEKAARLAKVDPGDLIITTPARTSTMFARPLPGWGMIRSLQEDTPRS